MQVLSFRLPALLCALALSGAGFNQKPAIDFPAPIETPMETPSTHAFQPSYFWYSALTGEFDFYQTIATEIWTLEIDFGVTVTQNPAGGLLLEQGYFNNAYPHNEPPSIFLYGHF